MSIYLRGRTWWLRYSDPNGEDVRETSGTTDRRAAERLERDRKREVAAGTWRPRTVGTETRPTVASFAPAWVASLRARNVGTVEDYAQRMRDHVVPVLGARPLDTIQPRDVAAFVHSLVASGQHAPRTIIHIFDALRSMMTWAKFEGVVLSNPCTDLPPGILPKKRDADPTWRATAVFDAHELHTLLFDERSPEDRRVMYALEALAMLRFGEAAGRRFSDILPARPLHRLVVATQYEGRETKTDTPRIVPIHPTLAAMLARWRLSGFASIMGRPPRPDDLIVPSRRGEVRSVRHGLHKLTEDLERLGLRARRQHDLRRTGISLARAGGARAEVLRVVSHGSPSEQTTVLDGYTTMPWGTLCEAVACIELPHNPPAQSAAVGDEGPGFRASEKRGGRDLNPNRKRARG
jgi:integrase